MKKRIVAIILTFSLCGCGSEPVPSQEMVAESPVAEKETDITPTEEITSVEATAPEDVTEVDTTFVEETEDVKDNVEIETDEENEQAEDDGWAQLEAMGDIEVEQGIFNVTLNIPKDVIGEVTQKELDENAEDGDYKSATLNEDGSVTMVMSKEQHSKMLKEITDQIDESLAGMIKSEDYPTVTNIVTNDNYTHFTVTTTNEEPDLGECFMVYAFYIYGDMYSIFSGENIDIIYVDYVNDATGEIIASTNSDKLKDE